MGRGKRWRTRKKEAIRGEIRKEEKRKGSKNDEDKTRNVMRWNIRDEKGRKIGGKEKGEIKIMNVEEVK